MSSVEQRPASMIWGRWERREPPKWFRMELAVRYECVRGNRILDFGWGKTIEICSREVLFTTQQTLKPDQRVRLAINWPVLLADTCFMKLAVLGWVARSQPGAATVKIERYEFRTAGMHPDWDPSAVSRLLQANGGATHV